MNSDDEYDQALRYTQSNLQNCELVRAHDAEERERLQKLIRNASVNNCRWSKEQLTKDYREARRRKTSTVTTSQLSGNHGSAYSSYIPREDAPEDVGEVRRNAREASRGIKIAPPHEISQSPRNNTREPVNRLNSCHLTKTDNRVASFSAIGHELQINVANHDVIGKKSCFEVPHEQLNLLSSEYKVTKKKCLKAAEEARELVRQLRENQKTGYDRLGQEIPPALPCLSPSARKIPPIKYIGPSDCHYNEQPVDKADELSVMEWTQQTIKQKSTISNQIDTDIACETKETERDYVIQCGERNSSGHGVTLPHQCYHERWIEPPLYSRLEHSATDKQKTYAAISTIPNSLQSLQQVEQREIVASNTGNYLISSTSRPPTDSRVTHADSHAEVKGRIRKPSPDNQLIIPNNNTRVDENLPLSNIQFSLKPMMEELSACVADMGSIIATHSPGMKETVINESHKTIATDITSVTVGKPSDTVQLDTSFAVDGTGRRASAGLVRTVAPELSTQAHGHRTEAPAADSHKRKPVNGNQINTRVNGNITETHYGAKGTSVDPSYIQEPKDAQVDTSEGTLAMGLSLNYSYPGDPVDPASNNFQRQQTVNTNTHQISQQNLAKTRKSSNKLIHDKKFSSSKTYKPKEQINSLTPANMLSKITRDDPTITLLSQAENVSTASSSRDMGGLATHESTKTSQGSQANQRLPPAVHRLHDDLLKTLLHYPSPTAGSRTASTTAEKQTKVNLDSGHSLSSEEPTPVGVRRTSESLNIPDSIANEQHNQNVQAAVTEVVEEADHRFPWSRRTTTSCSFEGCEMPSNPAVHLPVGKTSVSMPRHLIEADLPSRYGNEYKIFSTEHDEQSCCSCSLHASCAANMITQPCVRHYSRDSLLRTTQSDTGDHKPGNQHQGREFIAATFSRSVPRHIIQSDWYYTPDVASDEGPSEIPTTKDSNYQDTVANKKFRGNKSNVPSNRLNQQQQQPIKGTEKMNNDLEQVNADSEAVAQHFSQPFVAARAMHRSEVNDKAQPPTGMASATPMINQSDAATQHGSQFDSVPDPVADTLSSPLISTVNSHAAGSNSDDTLYNKGHLFQFHNESTDDVSQTTFEYNVASKRKIDPSMIPLIGSLKSIDNDSNWALGKSMLMANTNITKVRMSDIHAIPSRVFVVQAKGIGTRDSSIINQPLQSHQQRVLADEAVMTDGSKIVVRAALPSSMMVDRETETESIGSHSHTVIPMKHKTRNIPTYSVTTDEAHSASVISPIRLAVANKITESNHYLSQESFSYIPDSNEGKSNVRDDYEARNAIDLNSSIHQMTQSIDADISLQLQQLIKATKTDKNVKFTQNDTRHQKQKQASYQTTRRLTDQQTTESGLGLHGSIEQDARNPTNKPHAPHPHESIQSAQEIYDSPTAQQHVEVPTSWTHTLFPQMDNKSLPGQRATNVQHTKRISDQISEGPVGTPITQQRGFQTSQPHLGVHHTQTSQPCIAFGNMRQHDVQKFQPHQTFQGLQQKGFQTSQPSLEFQQTQTSQPQIDLGNTQQGDALQFQPHQTFQGLQQKGFQTSQPSLEFQQTQTSQPQIDLGNTRNGDAQKFHPHQTIQGPQQKGFHISQPSLELHHTHTSQPQIDLRNTRKGDVQMLQPHQTFQGLKQKGFQTSQPSLEFQQTQSSPPQIGSENMRQGDVQKFQPHQTFQDMQQKGFQTSQPSLEFQQTQTSQPQIGSGNTRQGNVPKFQPHQTFPDMQQKGFQTSQPLLEFQQTQTSQPQIGLGNTRQDDVQHFKPQQTFQGLQQKRFQISQPSLDFQQTQTSQLPIDLGNTRQGDIHKIQPDQAFQALHQKGLQIFQPPLEFQQTQTSQPQIDAQYTQTLQPSMHFQSTQKSGDNSTQPKVHLYHQRQSTIQTSQSLKDFQKAKPFQHELDIYHTPTTKPHISFNTTQQSQASKSQVSDQYQRKSTVQTSQALDNFQHTKTEHSGFQTSQPSIQIQYTQTSQPHIGSCDTQTSHSNLEFRSIPAPQSNTSFRDKQQSTGQASQPLHNGQYHSQYSNRPQSYMAIQNTRHTSAQNSLPLVDIQRTQPRDIQTTQPLTDVQRTETYQSHHEFHGAQQGSDAQISQPLISAQLTQPDEQHVNFQKPQQIGHPQTCQSQVTFRKSQPQMNVQQLNRPQAPQPSAEVLNAQTSKPYLELQPAQLTDGVQTSQPQVALQGLQSVMAVQTSQPHITSHIEQQGSRTTNDDLKSHAAKDLGEQSKGLDFTKLQSHTIKKRPSKDHLFNGSSSAKTLHDHSLAGRRNVITETSSRSLFQDRERELAIAKARESTYSDWLRKTSSKQINAKISVEDHPKNDSGAEDSDDALFIPRPAKEQAKPLSPVSTTGYSAPSSESSNLAAASDSLTTESIHATPGKRSFPTHAKKKAKPNEEVMTDPESLDHAIHESSIEQVGKANAPATDVQGSSQAAHIQKLVAVNRHLKDLLASLDQEKPESHKPPQDDINADESVSHSLSAGLPLRRDDSLTNTVLAALMEKIGSKMDSVAKKLQNKGEHPRAEAIAQANALYQSLAGLIHKAHEGETEKLNCNQKDLGQLMTSVACSLLSLCVYLKQPKEMCVSLPSRPRDQMTDTADTASDTSAEVPAHTSYGASAHASDGASAHMSDRAPARIISKPHIYLRPNEGFDQEGNIVEAAPFLSRQTTPPRAARKILSSRNGGTGSTYPKFYRDGSKDSINRISNSADRKAGVQRPTSKSLASSSKNLKASGKRLSPITRAAVKSPCKSLVPKSTINKGGVALRLRTSSYVSRLSSTNSLVEPVAPAKPRPTTNVKRQPASTKRPFRTGIDGCTRPC